jgi:DNA-binding response OmpR family regulator
VPHRPADPDPSRTPPRRGVLYIEDDANNIRLVERILEMRPGIPLTVARTGQQGLEHATTDRPELILLDRHLPDMSGDAVLAQLKSTDVTASIPVTIVSGDTDRNSIAAITMLGAAGYLIKPFDILELMATIDEHCTITAP